MILILTAECNSRCSYCYQTAKKALSMEWPILQAAIDLAFQSAASRIDVMFMGGEPLLEWSKILQAVDYAGRKAPSGKEVRYRISTNGFLVTDEIAGFLDEHRFDVQLSFDGIAEAQNHRREGSFAVIDRLLGRMRERQPDLFARKMRITMTVIPETVPYLADSVRYLLGKGARNISISPSCTPASGWVPEGRECLEDQFSRIYEDCLRDYEKTGESPLVLFRKSIHDRGPSRANRDMCTLLAGKTLAVDVDGLAYGCSLLVESYQQFPSEFLRSRLAPLRMGDVRGRAFRKRHAAFPETARKAEIFSHKEKKYSSYGKCAECPYLERCFVCPVSIGYDPGNTDPHRVPDFICAFNRTAQKYRDRFPFRPSLIDELQALLFAERE